jgi:hypothetical protein
MTEEVQQLRVASSRGWRREAPSAEPYARRLPLSTLKTTTAPDDDSVSPTSPDPDMIQSNILGVDPGGPQPHSLHRFDLH